MNHIQLLLTNNITYLKTLLLTNHWIYGWHLVQHTTQNNDIHILRGSQCKQTGNQGTYQPGDICALNDTVPIQRLHSL